jgi:hypothetical protein
LSPSTIWKRRVWSFPTAGELAEPRSNLWFLSVHTTQTQASQMSCKKERRAREAPARKVNWTKWSRREVYSTSGMSIHECTNAQREPKVPHEMNKWYADSASPQPEIQKWAAVDKMPRATLSTSNQGWI